jgi:hypothetical protein
MPSALVPLANLTLGSAAATVTFSSISQSYRDLMLVATATISAGTGKVRFQINGDTASNYSTVYMSGSNYSVASSTSATTFIGSGAISELTTNLGQTIFHALDFSATDKHKSFLIRSNNSALGTIATMARWASTSAVTSVVVYPSTSTFAAGSSFMLYGVSA